MGRGFLEDEPQRFNLVDVEATYAGSSDAAWSVINDEDGRIVWLPKSLVELERVEHGARVVVTLPDWLAKQKGLV